MPMDASQVALISGLLDEVMDLSGPERERWLAALPQQHAHLRESLRAMLDIGVAATALPKLEQVDPASHVPGAHEGERVGPYRLLRPIGEGGMGSVWLAERADGNFERQVALKLPRLSWMQGLAERMARERHIGALLEHPHIARLYDAGVDDKGRPYIAMAYIDGPSIDTWCDQRGLDTRARLSLFLQVVRAVAYAHGRRVIHRDLKPANVLVDTTGQVHLLDFGIAKLVADALLGDELTLEQGRAFTPHYAAPEQIAGEPVTLLSDVYSLGVMLFELLTGRRPFVPKRATTGALEEAVLQGDAPLASTLVAGDAARVKALRPDLDAVLAMALRRDPQRRYASAEALAEDIERHLAGYPVQARPDTAAYRLGRFVARQRVGVGVTAAVAALLVTSGSLTWWQSRQAGLQAERTRRATELIAEVFRAEVARSNNAAEGGAFLDRGAQLVQARFSNEPAMQAELYGVLGRAYSDVGARDLAVAYAQRQIDALERAGADPGTRVQAHLRIADARLREGRMVMALAQHKQAVVLAGTDPVLLAAAQAMQARIALADGRLPEAAELIASAEPVLSAAGHPPPLALAWLLDAKAISMRMNNRFDESVPVLERAVAIAFEAEGPRSTLASHLQAEHATRLVARGRMSEAQPLIDAVLKRLDEEGGAAQLRAALFRMQAWALMHTMWKATTAETEAVLTRSLTELTAQRAVVPAPVLADAQGRMGGFFLDIGRIESARPFLRAASDIAKAHGETVWDRYGAAATEGQYLAYAGQHREADPLLREARDLRVQANPKAVYNVQSWALIGLNLIMAGDAAAALRALEGAPEFGVDASSASKNNYGWVLQAIRARAHLELGRPAQAAQAVPLFLEGVNEPGYLSRRALAGEILCAAGNPAEGLPVLLKAIDDAAKRVDALHPNVARSRAVAGRCALAAGDRTLAESMAGLANTAFTRQPEVSPWFKAPSLRLQQELARPPPAARADRGRVAPPAGR